MKPLISDIKANKADLLEAGLATVDFVCGGFNLSGTYNLGKTFSIFLAQDRKYMKQKSIRLSSSLLVRQLIKV